GAHPHPSADCRPRPPSPAVRERGAVDRAPSAAPQWRRNYPDPIPMNDVMQTPPAADPVSRARGLAETIAAHADAVERTRRFPAALLDALHEARLFRMLYPRSVGGDEVEPSIYVRAMEEISRVDGSVGWCVSIANSTGLIAPYLDRDIARRI